MFSSNAPRFASYSIISSLPDPLIDEFWFLLDQNLKNIFPLSNLVKFDLVNNNQTLSYDYINDNNELVATFDTPFPYRNSYPKSAVVYDNGEQQIIAEPNELNI
ncbi:DUF960 family protein [Lentilactobacillus laojiaonis]|uniref:DUF960 family protein n=1 Tax=Lentilactobacillus laojiaonis TaxID=2883998 RepID=UPI001D0B2C67|nr:DUF960 family protein [Lentilactobacillus laojiaonis]UDM31789.1 DUF960 domain-containing protein [Lentilactobacillus laojiaonis]